jgi:RNA polymerase sigma-70 factor (ECF subfamily)
VNKTSEQTEFVQLLTNFQRRLFAYIATLLPHPADTEEVLQQTNLVLWSKAAQFEPGTCFRAWSFRIAYLEVLAFRRRGSRDRQVFSADLAETMAAEVEDTGEPSAQALRACLEKLPSGDRDLLSRRYGGEGTIKQLAEAMGRPASSIYRSLDRIRYSLLNCVQRAQAAEDRQ